MNGRQASFTCPLCGSPLAEALYEATDPRFDLEGRFRVVWCGGCGNASTLPRPSSTELMRHYPAAYDPYQPDLSARSKSAVHRWFLTGEKRLSEAATDSLPIGALLDVGCGNGAYMQSMAARGFAVTGIEMDERACELVARRGLRVTHGDFLDVEVAAESFDVVAMNHFLEHSSDPKASLKKAWTVLRPGGRLLVGVPNFDSWARRHFGADWSDLELPRHLTHFTPGGLTRLLGESGFSDVRMGHDPTADANSILTSFLVRTGKRDDPVLRTLYPALHLALYPVALPLAVLHRSAWLRVSASKPGPAGASTLK